MLGKQRKLPLPRGGERSCKPDIIASKKMGKEIYIIECKRCRGLRQIGHAFGQLFVDEVVINRIKKKDWTNFIRCRINENATESPKIIYAVAFDSELDKDNNAKKIIKQFQHKFQGYSVFL